MKHIGIEEMPQEKQDLLEQWINDADTDGDGLISKVELKKFLMMGVKRKLFKGHFKKEQDKYDHLVLDLFESIFSGAFDTSADENALTRDEFVDAVEDKLSHDPPLKEYLIESFDQIDTNGDGNLDKDEIKRCLTMLIKKQNVDIIANNGSFARQYIERMYNQFEETRANVDNPDNNTRVENPY